MYLERNFFRFKMMYVEDSFEDELAIVFFNERRVHQSFHSLLLLLLCRLNRQKFVGVDVVRCHTCMQLNSEESATLVATAGLHF